jgi:hypothetical protein
VDLLKLALAVTYYLMWVGGVAVLSCMLCCGLALRLLFANADMISDVSIERHMLAIFCIT